MVAMSHHTNSHNLATAFLQTKAATTHPVHNPYTSSSSNKARTVHSRDTMEGSLATVLQVLDMGPDTVSPDMDRLGATMGSSRDSEVAKRIAALHC